MKIFVIGQSGTGKTPIAAKISEALSFNHVKASEYFRKTFTGHSDDRNEFTKMITEYSAHVLKENPYVNIDYLKDKLQGNCVVEGVRNPIDFSNLFEFGKDKIIFLEYRNNPILKTDFENGLDIIESIMSWAQQQGIVSENDFIRIQFDQFFGPGSLEEQIEEFLDGTRTN